MDTKNRFGGSLRARRGPLLFFLLALAGVPLLTVLIHRDSPVRFEPATFPSLEDVSESAWERLSRKTIFFGHQSVGFNIIDGIRELVVVNPRVRLSIVETDNPAQAGAPVFAHAPIGRNTDPKSKIDAFAALMENGVADSVDIALFKFCYVDIVAGTEIETLFRNYQDALSELKAAYPRTVFVHVTVPLTTIQPSTTAWIKRVMGRSVRGQDDNIARSRFNEMLRANYDGKEPLFDLAAVEAGSVDGKRAVYERRGQTFYTMFPEFTHDGGHLNRAGRLAAATQLVILLAEVSK